MNKKLVLVLFSVIMPLLLQSNFLVEKFPENVQNEIKHVVEALPQRQQILPLISMANKEYTTELVHVPFLICNVEVDFAVKASTYLKIWCEWRIGEHVFNFCFNDLSFNYHIDTGALELDGKISNVGFTSFKITFDTDGYIEGSPKLVLYSF